MNSRCCCIRNIAWGISAAAVLCVATHAPAQTVYKQVDAAGAITFTDRAPADGIVAPYAVSLNQELASIWPARIVAGTRSDVANALLSNSAMTSMYAATVDLNEAARRLRQARQSLQEAMELRSGEWADSAGASDMNKRYHKRRQKLEREVVAAERRSHETSLVQSALLRNVLVKSNGKTEPFKVAQP